MKRLLPLAIILVIIPCAVKSQDSVDVTFRFLKGSAPTVYLVGEFNNPPWTNTQLPMTFDGSGVWTRTVRLPLGGNPNPPAVGVPGAWQYKFYYSGVSDWPNDPLNWHVNPRDNNNTFIYTRDPTIYQLQPNQRQPLVETSTPTISAFVFPKVGGSVDSNAIVLNIDSIEYAVPASAFSSLTHQLNWTITDPLLNGPHTMILTVHSSTGGVNADTVSFVSQAGFLRFSTQSGYATRNPLRTLRGVVKDTTIQSIVVIKNGTDTSRISCIGGVFSFTDTLVEGLNRFVAIADSAGTPWFSDPATFTYIVNHAPHAVIGVTSAGPSIVIMGTQSTDPDSGQTPLLTYTWAQDPSNPASIAGIDGASTSTLLVNRPAVPGEYYLTLVVADPDGNRDTTRNFFTVTDTSTVVGPTLATVPAWVKQGRMYLMFFKMHTPAGTINAAIPDLDRIAAMGYNIIWVLPVMKIDGTIDNGTAIGYEIVDFTTVAPEYGTNQDFKNFVARAHQLGMKVILDVTPNHTSHAHPFVLDARTYGQDSRYWNYYQHGIIPYSGPGLGNLPQSLTSDGFVYYSGFSDALLNYNWSDVDARTYMIDVYKYWMKEFSIDGYRFDVYWGPHSRANSPQGGEGEMGRPVREALKHIKPDINLLGEASGTGAGTEVLYADYFGASGSGGVDEAYDWSLKGYLQSDIWSLSASTRVNNLDAQLRNGSATSGMGFVPGPNSSFLRFLENQDEDRISYVYGNGVTRDVALHREMPISSAVNLAVGMPLVYAGQEVGRGYGISNFDARRRGVIDFSDTAGLLLMPHYQKLAQIKKQFHAFWTQKMVRLVTDVSGVYAYSRPYSGQNAIVVANLQDAPQAVHVSLNSAGTPPSVEGVSDGTSYVVSDLYSNDTTGHILFSGGTATLSLDLPSFGTAVLVIDRVSHTLTLPSLTSVDPLRGGVIPDRYSLQQNYPNPFNPSTTIQYTVGGTRGQGLGASEVRIVIYDVLGREVATLVNARQSPGTYEVRFDGLHLSSGIYFYRLTAGAFAATRAMLLLK